MSDSQLLRRAVKGDGDALASLLTRHGPAVRTRVAKMIACCWRPVLSPEDVMQVTYVEVFLGISRRNPRTPKAFLSWLLKMAKNNVRDAIRELQAAKRPDPRRRVIPPPADDSVFALYELVGRTDSTPSRAAARKEAKEALIRALEQIPNDYRRVVELYDLEDRPAEEVASIMKRSRGKRHLFLRHGTGRGPRA